MLHLNFWVRISLFSLIFACLMGLTNFALAQSTPAETLTQLMANDDTAKEEFTRVIHAVQEYEESMHQEIGSLQQQINALNSIKGTYITKVGDTYMPIDEAEVENLAALVALRMMLYPDEIDNILVLETSSQLDMALRAAIAATYVQGSRYPSGVTPQEFTIPMVHTTLLEITKRNYEEIANRIAELEQQIAQLKQGINSLGELVEQAVAVRDKAPDLATLSGILGAKGYYVVRLSGGGWIKRSGGNATYSSGYEYFLILAKKDRTQPAKAYYWEFPIGYDANKQFQIWIKEKEEESRKACRDLPALGRVSRPHIWVEGPRYEIVYGSYEGKTPSKYGSRRVSNGKDGSAFQWVHTSGKIADVKADCAALGAAF